jgi:Tol biopolymer transport system component
MKANRSFEQDLPRLLDDLYLGPMPEYRDQLIERIARTRQRSTWSSGRWLPSFEIARQPVRAPQIPWRAVGVGLVVLALLVGMLAALSVGRAPELPEPFGLARTGLVAFSSGGDLYTVDAATGSSTAIVRGPEVDLGPRWSRDGTRLVFERKAEGDSGPGWLYVARADGSDIIRITDDPLAAIQSYEFSPTGDKVLISANTQILVAEANGAGLRQLDVGGPATNLAWRPPDGSEILFMDAGNTSSGFGRIRAVAAEGGEVRTIVPRAPARYHGGPSWSPDGKLISYVEWQNAPRLTAQVHIVRADGTSDRTLPIPRDASWQSAQAWSNDGTRLLAIRGTAAGYEGSRPVVIPVDGSGPGVKIDYPGVANGECCSVWEWAPDDSLILGTPTDRSGEFLSQVMLDPVAGTSRTLPWNSVSRPSWQRLAP